MFWTIPLPDKAADIEPGAGRASFRMGNLQIADYGSIPNGPFHFTPPVQGRVTFDVEWSGKTSETKVRNSDPSQPYGGNFGNTGTHISWNGCMDDTLVFGSSDDRQTTNFGQVAKGSTERSSTAESD